MEEGTRDPLISRRHLRVSFDKGQFLVSDLGSRNGTRLNGVRVSGLTPMHIGDHIEVVFDDDHAVPAVDQFAHAGLVKAEQR